MKQRFPELSTEEVADYLKDNAEDRGETGPDNTWGYGYATLPASDANFCIQSIYGDVNLDRNWDGTCLSQNRPNDEEGPGDGDYYARFYTFVVGAGKKLTINLSSEKDTYLYLMEGEGKDGAIEALNDDVTPYIDYNSRIVVDNLEAGEYTIEATTYAQETDGEFTLTMEVTEAGEEAEPAPEPTPSASGPFTDFSRGTDHVCALRNDDAPICWGSVVVSP